MNPRTLIVTVALGVAATVSADAQVELSRSVTGSGATAAGNSAVSLRGTVAQPVIGRASNGVVTGSFGFWQPTFGGTSAVRDREVREAAAAAVRVTPHPVVDRATVAIELEGNDPVTLRLYDAAGNLRMTLLDAERRSGTVEVELASGELESGTYALVLGAGSRQVTRTIQITH